MKANTSLSLPVNPVLKKEITLICQQRTVYNFVSVYFRMFELKASHL